jgi:hypothetical protein
MIRFINGVVEPFKTVAISTIGARPHPSGSAIPRRTADRRRFSG